MTVIYLDSVFILNGLMDYLLLTASARLSGIVLCRGRYLLAALFGGTYAAAVFLPGGGFLSEWPVKLAAGVLMGLIAYGGEQKLLRLMLLSSGIACGMAGAVLTVGLLSGEAVPMVSGVFYTDVSPRVLLISATAAYLVLTVIFRSAAGHGVQGELLPVRLCIHGTCREFTALRDTGNSLRDPVGDRPVLVLSAATARELLPIEENRDPVELTELLRMRLPELHPRLLPYRAVGIGQGLLPVVTAEYAEIGGVLVDGLPVGISSTELGDGYRALWGGKGKGECYESIAGTVAEASDPVGTASGGRSSLHWRKRHPAAAARKSQRGGTAG